MPAHVEAGAVALHASAKTCLVENWPSNQTVHVEGGGFSHTYKHYKAIT